MDDPKFWSNAHIPAFLGITKVSGYSHEDVIAFLEENNIKYNVKTDVTRSHGYFRYSHIEVANPKKVCQKFAYEYENVIKYLKAERTKPEVTRSYGYVTHFPFEVANKGGLYSESGQEKQQIWGFYFIESADTKKFDGPLIFDKGRLLGCTDISKLVQE